MPKISCEDAQQRIQGIKVVFGDFKKKIEEYAATGSTEVLEDIKFDIIILENGTKKLREGLVVSHVRAYEILGQDFLGPEAVEKTFKITLSHEQIPPIPFSEKDLERAKELGQFLILRTPLTMQTMETKMKEPTFQNDWFKQEDFYTKDTSKAGWALVTKKEIPNSENRNYLKQTEKIIDYLENHVFRGMQYPVGYLEAINEFHQNDDEIKALINTDRKQAAKRLSELKITKLTRQSPADVIHDLLVYEHNNQGKLLRDVYTWTNAHDSDGDLVVVGYFKSDGLDFDGVNPGDAGVDLGVVYSRSQ